jgi:tetratricopeptide (TPR) repeat protein
MRFVQGETLQAALERFHAESRASGAAPWSLQLRHLLRRFLDVCDAIEYVHSRGVIHRDLKPSNILLGTYGETLIIDWGIAKIVGQDEAEASRHPEVEPVVLTHSGSIDLPTIDGEAIGSPPYMSPEQARGSNEELGPASDVYGLGATLYAILTGRPPVVARKTSEILARVRKGDIDPPAQANPRVPKPLDAICRKAMRPEPGDRYSSARALAEDLERWMADQPVSVFADPLSTRLVRWARRHKSLVAASLALLLASIVGLSVATVVVGEQKNQAMQARQAAADELRDGLEILDQLVTLGDRLLISQLPPSDRDRFLRAALNYIRLKDRVQADPAIKVQTSEISRRVANLYLYTGQFAQAEPFYEQAISILEGLGPGWASSFENFEMLEMTRIDQGQAWLVGGRFRDADRVLTRARDVARDYARAHPDRVGGRRLLAKSLYMLGSAHRSLGRPDAADLCREAVEQIEPLADDSLPNVKQAALARDPLPLLDQIDLANALGEQAAALEQAGKLVEAEAQYRLALDRMGRVLKQFQGLPSIDVDFAQAWAAGRLDRFLVDRGRGDQAIGPLGEAIERLEGVVKRSNGEVYQYRTTLADAYSARARAFEGAGGDKDEEARADAETAQVLLESLLRQYPEVPDHPTLLAEALDTLARLALRRGPPGADRARTLLREAARLQKDVLGRNPENPALRKALEDYEKRLRALDVPATGPGPAGPG